ncbi:Retrotransposon-derived protein PEG10 [Smittium culicis]|uniref:Retrotransposon-derived protein PEG10 n=1 Tax=Smittium culicis TaxID=133412 RepID=A0A1R1YM71_9FUNG|nr:Retrotransposon-derived protein PEG10 [Smittium culicis]
MPLRHRPFYPESSPVPESNAEMKQIQGHVQENDVTPEQHSFQVTMPRKRKAFIQEFANNFSDPSHGIKIRKSLRNCKQGSRDVISYATEFRSLARESGFDDTALIYQFLHGLNPKITQFLMIVDLPTSLEEIIRVTCRVDNRISTIDQINAIDTDHKSLNPFRKQFPRGFTPSRTTVPQSQDQTVYMEIDAIASRPRGPLTEKGNTTRYELVLCLHCGGSGQIDRECTKKPSSGKAGAQQ